VKEVGESLDLLVLLLDYFGGANFFNGLLTFY